MHYLSDELLVEAFMKAVVLNTDQDFIHLLENEIKRRGISLEEVLRGS
ncbi:sporulation histidine kinase inhibitor Sda [Aquibacillus albus]|uniref:DNA-binding phage protein n=1 Tax=Aquibacillus albus TaxID=1168171 RepID=A0ABS2N2M3_9BACI|nr:sporulation histidine kinase inhibitor Sda [Aquibacillus albus]MBM7572391.1 DNA-binding phage protein [Aquibacillus albus]